MWQAHMDWQNLSPLWITVCIGAGIFLLAMFNLLLLMPAPVLWGRCPEGGGGYIPAPSIPTTIGLK